VEESNMSSVSKKRETSKKKPADLRLLAKAEREDRGEKPVTEGIHRAAERAGISASAEPAADSRQLAKRTLTLTLAETCELVGRDLAPSQFSDEGFDSWCVFQNLHDRIILADKIAAVIGGAS
jgi:hypothetical protein